MQAKGDNIPDPGDWASGDEAITESQMDYLGDLLERRGKEVPKNLYEMTKAEASSMIAELREER